MVKAPRRAPRYHPAAPRGRPARHVQIAEARRHGAHGSSRRHRRPVRRRVIFLDFDGVLAPIRRWDRYEDLDPACVAVLNEIVAAAGADVVISSTHRHGKTVGELQAMLQAEGFTGCVLGKTPTGAPGAGRADEIAAWLAEHPVVGYVIIDDHADMGALHPHLVQTHPAHGLRVADVPRAIAILMRPPTLVPPA